MKNINRECQNGERRSLQNDIPETVRRTYETKIEMDGDELRNVQNIIQDENGYKKSFTEFIGEAGGMSLDNFVFLNISLPIVIYDDHEFNDSEDHENKDGNLPIFLAGSAALCLCLVFCCCLCTSTTTTIKKKTRTNERD
eukprot:UN30081